ncbi:unnamed protein product, partial [Sphacelaria rigidula]
GQLTGSYCVQRTKDLTEVLPSSATCRASVTWCSVSLLILVGLLCVLISCRLALLFLCVGVLRVLRCTSCPSPSTCCSVVIFHCNSDPASKILLSPLILSVMKS